MTTDILASILYVVACGVLAVAMFCRAVALSKRAWLPIRLGVCAAGGAAVYGLYAVLVLDYVPGWPSAALALAWVAMSSASSRAWVGGMPQQYLQPTDADLEDAARGSGL